MAKGPASNRSIPGLRRHRGRPLLQLLVTVWIIPVLFVQTTLPPGFTDAAANGEVLLVMLTLTSVSTAPAETFTDPVIGEW